MVPINVLFRKNTYLLSLLLVISTSSIFCQVSPSLFIVADYMKVQPGLVGEYLEVEQTIWKPLHKQRITDGIIVGWYLYAVSFAGAGSEFNYVVLNLYDDQKYLENPWSAEILAQVHPKMEAQEIMTRTNQSRVNVRSELFYSIAVAPEIPLAEPAAYLQVNYMKVDPGMQNDYEKLESEIWQPVHNELVNNKRTAGWGLWAVLFPRGADRSYQYCTLNAFSDFSYVFDLNYANSFSIVHANKDLEETLRLTRETRIIVSTELWELIDYEIK